jgi:alanine racemase
MVTNRSWAEINLAALERNLRLIRDSLPKMSDIFQWLKRMRMDMGSIRQLQGLCKAG